jgi:hypothetical protein
MEKPKQYTEARLKLLSRLPESRAPRWNYVEILPGTKKGEPQYRFIGKPVSQTEHEAIFKDQDGQVYYLCHILFFKVDHDAIAVRAERVESGKTLYDIFERLEKIQGSDFEPPKILTNELKKCLEGLSEL